MLKYVALVSVLLSSAAFADEAPQAPAPDAAATETSGDAILVTATRLPTRLDEVPASITVLDKAAIDRSQDIGVTELLIRTPGISITRNGGYGTATSVRIRGAETDQTVAVIDGVKLNDPSSTGGGYNFANLLVGDAERIEVLRGPQSILWGSQAIGGVVNVVTALPTKELEGSFDVEAGSRQTVNARAALGGKSGPLTWRIGAQAFTTDGISAVSKDFGGVETDGDNSRSLTGRFELALADNVSLDLRGYYETGTVQIDGFNVDSAEYSKQREMVGYAGLNVALLDGRFRNRFAVGYTDTDRDNFDPNRERQQTFDASGSNRRFEYQGSFAIADGWTAVFGAENEHSKFSSVSPPAALATPVPAATRGSVDITSVYGQLNASPISGLTLNAGVRYDDHSQTGGHTLFGGGAVWKLPTGTILRASYGEGFKAPTLYQLFSEYGNTALKPEQAKGWEAGIEQHLFGDKVSLGATYFERTTKQQIIFASCPFSGPLPAICFVPGTTTARFGYYDNVAKAEAHGIEAVAEAKFGGLSIDGNYSWTVAEDRSPGATFGKWLPRRPRNAANGSISYDFPFGLTLGGAVRWSGKTYDNAANTTLLKAYTLVDLRAEYALSDSLKLFARAENLFDEDYMTAYRFGTLGRSIYAGIRGRF